MADNPVIFDECIAPIMGVDAKDIPTISTARRIRGKYQLVQESNVGIVISNDDRWNGKTSSMIKKKESLCYVPSSGWKKVFYSTRNKAE